MLQGLLESPSQREIDTYSIALIYVALDHPDEAIEWLDKACNGHTGMFAYVANGDPRLDGLRPDPRYGRLMQRMGEA